MIEIKFLLQSGLYIDATNFAHGLAHSKCPGKNPGKAHTISFQITRDYCTGMAMHHIGGKRSPFLTQGSHSFITY